MVENALQFQIHMECFYIFTMKPKDQIQLIEGVSGRKQFEIPEYIRIAIKVFIDLLIELYIPGGDPIFPNINFYTVTRLVQLQWPYIPIDQIIDYRI